MAITKHIQTKLKSYSESDHVHVAMKQKVPQEMPCSIQQGEVDQNFLETQKYLTQMNGPLSLRIQLAEPSAKEYVKSPTKKKYYL